MVRLCGSKNDIIYCHSQGQTICCFNNKPCMKSVAKVKEFDNFAYAVNRAIHEKKYKNIRRGSYGDYSDYYVYEG